MIYFYFLRHRFFHRVPIDAIQQSTHVIIVSAGKQCYAEFERFNLRVLDMPLKEIADFPVNRDVSRINEKIAGSKRNHHCKGDRTETDRKED